MTAPLVSLIIPCHNAEAWLAETVESALAQTWPHREIIVVNDGSRDGSLTVAQRFTGRGVTVVNQPNRGASAARNHGFRLARGAFIKFLDADDLLSPDALSAQVAALAGNPSGLAFGPWARFHEDHSRAVFTPHPGWHDGNGLAWIKETWRDTEPMYQCGIFLIPRLLLEKSGGWDERLTLIDDFEFFTRLALASSGLVFTPDAKLLYRSGLPGSLSGHKSRRAWESAILSTNLAIGHLLAVEDSGETRRLSANMLQKLIYSFYPEHGDLRQAVEQRVAELGGSDLRPGGGAGFQKLARLAGWRFAAGVRHLIGRRPR
jgi:glycosyltransferase involved in cell wall biosynthesis